MSQKQLFLITGSSSCLGRSMVDFLVRDKNVSVLSTTREPTPTLELANRRNHLHLAGIDLLNSSDVAALTQQVNRWADGPFTVVHCVGCFPAYKDICQTDLSEVRRVYEANVFTLYAITPALIPLMKVHGGGHFIAFSSHTVYEAYPLMAAFTSAKAAVESLVRSIANEYSKDKIFSTALALATLDTPKERKMRPRTNHSDWLKPIQVCRLVRTLAKDPIMNGNTIHLFNYSNSFFHQSYYDRIGLDSK